MDSQAKAGTGRCLVIILEICMPSVHVYRFEMTRV